MFIFSVQLEENGANEKNTKNNQTADVSSSESVT